MKNWKDITYSEELTFPIKTDFAFLKLAPSFSYSGASFLQCPHLPMANIWTQLVHITT